MLLCSEDEGQDRKAIAAVGREALMLATLPSLPLQVTAALHTPAPSLLSRAGAVASIAVLAEVRRSRSWSYIAPANSMVPYGTACFSHG